MRKKKTLTLFFSPTPFVHIVLRIASCISKKAHCKNASAVVINTDASPMYTSFDTCTVCLCSRINSQTAVSKCSGTANTAFTCFVDIWCHPWHVYLSGSRLCVQHVRKLLNRAEWIRAALSHDLSVFNKNIFQRSVKRCWCFYNLCLGSIKWENLGFPNI